MAQEGAKVVTNDLPLKSIPPNAYVLKWISTLSRERREFVAKRSAEMKGEAEAAAKEILKMGGEVLPFPGDVSSFTVGRELIQAPVSKFGKPDILVNNAGTFRRGPIWEVAEED